MSTFPQYLAMHDVGGAFTFHSSHYHGSHAVHQAPLTTPHVPCPYEDKVTKDGTTARMVLLFLRELLEQLSVEERAQQSYGCPMTKCHRTFAAPLQVVHHLLSCPEIPNGEFNCDKCSTSHIFPTNEKDWAHWMGWKPSHSSHGGHVQRKRSLGSKMKEFALRKIDPSRKHHPTSDPHFKGFSSRPSTAASEAPSVVFTGRALQHPPAFHQQPGQGPGANFTGLQKSVLPSGLPEVDDSMFWTGLDAMSSDLPSTVSSVALSSTIDDTASERFSQNTSQTTLFTTGLGQYQPRTRPTQDSNTLPTSQQYVLSTQLPFNAGLAPLPGQAPPTTGMHIDEPIPLAQTPLSPTEVPSATPDSHGWWGPKIEATTTPRPTPPVSRPDPCFPLQPNVLGNLPGGINSPMSSPTSPCAAASPYYPIQSTSAHSMSRALSHESMQSGMTTTVFGSPVPEGSGLGPLSSQSTAAGPGQPVVAETDSVEDLVCDECQWKPRGVRENLKGYLRKHKNTHKGVRLACDVPGCVKTFSRLDNLKKHKKDKHGIEDVGGSVPAKRMAGDVAEAAAMEEEGEIKRPVTGTLEPEVRAVNNKEDYSTLWPALHF